MAGSKSPAAEAPEVPEKVEAPTVPEALLERLLEVAQEVGRIEKNGRNDHHKYDYVQASDVTERVGDLLHDRGVLVIPSARNARHEGVLTTIDLSYRFVAVDTGEDLDIPWVGVGFDKGGDKGVYKAMTGGLKYVLLNLFLIPTGDDPEGDRVTHAGGAAPTAVPTIPTDRATRLAERCQAANVKGAVLKAKLAEIGVAGISALNVDQAEAFEAWLADEEAGVAS